MAQGDRRDYIDGRQLAPERIADAVGPMEFLVEAAGAPELAFDLIEALGRNGIYILIGIPAGHCVASLPACDLARDLVLENQVLIGIVNAARGHFRMAVDDLVHAHDRWPGHLERLITHRYAPADAATALHGHPEDEIKAVVEWGHAGGDRGRDHGTG